MQVWKKPPEHLSIDRSAIHIWRGTYFNKIQESINSTNVLSPAEIEKSKRFVRISDRDRYLFAHTMLRWIISFYIGCKPDSIIFKTNQYGKPALADRVDISDIRFSLSHSGDLVLVALRLGNEVGIDVERLREIDDINEIIVKNFSDAEVSFLKNLPRNELKRSFFLQWVLKESFIKGIGKGLYFPLFEFTVEPKRSIGKNEHGRFFSVKTTESNNWQCIALSLDEGYVGALATESIPEKFCYWNYCP